MGDTKELCLCCNQQPIAAELFVGSRGGPSQAAPHDAISINDEER